MHSRNVFLILPLFSSLAFAQLPMIPFSGGYSGTSDGGIKGSAMFGFSSRTIQLMANAPYSGEAQHESNQTLADGTHVVQTMPAPGQKVWRDSQGRVRIELALGSSNPKHPTLVQIEDPVSGYVIVMDDVNRVAHRTKASVVPQSSLEPVGRNGAVTVVPRLGAVGPPAAADVKPRPQTSAPEDLGMQTIDGLAVHGTRTTTVIPAGSSGNDAPITTTRETWFSPELNMMIRTVTNDPRSGTSTDGIANLSRNEPDPGLFIVPADYAIVDETAGFTIKWGEN